MKIYAIRDKFIKDRRDIGYLFYYEKSRLFFIELLTDIDEWEAPFLLAGHIKQGIYSIGSEWSKKWVDSRIIPSDRQNLGMILKENSLKEYDEYKLLVLSDGRCAQDDIYIAPTKYEALPKEIMERLKKKIREIIPSDDNKIIVFFKDDTAKMVNIAEITGDNKAFLKVLRDKEVFISAKVLAGGNGISWGSDKEISAALLYKSGEKLSIGFNDLLSFLGSRILNTSEVAKSLNCSRQYIYQLVTEDKLHPINTESNNYFFLKSEVESML